MASEPSPRASQLLTGELVSGMITGGITSTIGTTAMYPLHRLKVIMQTQDGHPSVASGKIPRYTLVHSFGRLIKVRPVTSKGVPGIIS